ncbi:hypothetical protein E3N88_00084 [Mikania micrantha]|uniref:Uncharacterized protein n=1 Tax=Mikania micrantha TaxID=192012 RepID=A0A5N6PYI0_9ASTR|nr:hypothetical protein E3N88_00083 [Mikania micrantha]KAD7476948.1 hypothetical protein E3N88_00084 [Mikania micrantha]
MSTDDRNQMADKSVQEQCENRMYTIYPLKPPFPVLRFWLEIHTKIIITSSFLNQIAQIIYRNDRLDERNLEVQGIGAISKYFGRNLREKLRAEVLGKDLKCLRDKIDIEANNIGEGMVAILRLMTCCTRWISIKAFMFHSFKPNQPIVDVDPIDKVKEAGTNLHR